MSGGKQVEWVGGDPIPMILHCPDCGERHLDLGDWVALNPHHTHACQHCGFVWRPALVNTVGVQFLPGFGPVPEPEAPEGEKGTKTAYLPRLGNVLCSECPDFAVWRLPSGKTYCAAHAREPLVEPIDPLRAELECGRSCGRVATRKITWLNGTSAYRCNVCSNT